jgi:hypothetical protein
MNSLQNHKFKVLISERVLRKQKRHIKNLLIHKLQETGNEPLLTNEILSFLSGHCNKCGIKVTQLKYHKRYKSICYICYKKYKP